VSPALVGSHSRLQQSERTAHPLPGAPQRTSRQTPPSHRPEQQSEPVVHVEDTERHAGTHASLPLVAPASGTFPM